MKKLGAGNPFVGMLNPMQGMAAGGIRPHFPFPTFPLQQQNPAAASASGGTAANFSEGLFASTAGKTSNYLCYIRRFFSD